MLKNNSRKILRPTLETKKQGEEAEPLHATLDGKISGYASLFDLVDLGNDCVVKGAFEQSLAKRSAREIRMLFQHDPDRPIGVWDHIYEDEKGLFVSGRINAQTDLGNEILSLVRMGALEGLSIGFKTRKAKKSEKNGIRHLLELDLWEVSIVTFPMQPEACIGQVKRVCLNKNNMFSGVLPTPRKLEHWLTRDAGLSRRAAQTLLAKGYGAAREEGARDAANHKKPLVEIIRQATRLIQNR